MSLESNLLVSHAQIEFTQCKELKISKMSIKKTFPRIFCSIEACQLFPEVTCSTIKYEFSIFHRKLLILKVKSNRASNFTLMEVELMGVPSKLAMDFSIKASLASTRRSLP